MEKRSNTLNLQRIPKSVFKMLALLPAFAIAAGIAGPPRAASAYDAHVENRAEMPWVYNAAWGSAPHKYVTTESGLQFRLLEWKGEDSSVAPSMMMEGDQVEVMYKMFRRDTGDSTTGVDWKTRVHVYSQANMANTLVLTLGSGSVVVGVDEAVRILIRLEKSRGRFLLPSSLAYGERGALGMDIPKNAEIEYFIEIVKRTRNTEL